MKLQIMSDLHLEFYKDHGEYFINTLDPTGVDALILAGDIFPFEFYTEVLEIFQAFCNKYPHVFYVPGNHEFYGCNIKEVENILQVLEKNIPNLYILNCDKIKELDNHRFLGGTMWFKDDVANNHFKDMMNDFWEIKGGFVPWVYKENIKFINFVEGNAKKGDIIITHHLPTAFSTPDRFKTSALNRFFLCDMENFIKVREPALWIHGHTHTPCDYVINKTRVIANPLGYPNEHFNFNKKLVIDV